MSKKIWSGRFNKDTESLMEKFSSSISFDQKLFEQDIRVNQAWARTLVQVGVYSESEAQKVVATLADIEKDFNKGRLTFTNYDEDIHSANERWLTERLGELGARIHTGRSRNDQVVTDLRMYLREEIRKLSDANLTLQEIVVGLAEKHIETVMPGYTHMRQAQPISLAHYLMSLVFQLQRDEERMRQVLKRINKMPLGSGAIAGTAFTIDRFKLAKSLGFDAPTENSIDATSDRDSIIEVVSICAQVMLHLSRIAEDLVVWSSEGFRFVAIDDAYATGSSMMPHKKNPDALELIRGKSARVIGNLVKLLALMKGIPTAYVRDLQEDKEAIFDSVDQTLYALLIFSGIFKTIRINSDNMLEELDPALYATDVADYLVRKGMPFRKAHEIVGSLVTYAENKKTSLQDLSFEEFHRFSELFDKDVYDLFDPVTSINSRNIYGGTGPVSLKKQIEQAKKIMREFEWKK